MENTRKVGAEHEELAKHYLTNLGYRFVAQNFHFGRAGEIDLIMRDGPVYVFVEVKMRRGHWYGLPEDSITPAKRSKIRRIAEGFIYVRSITDYEARFDVVAVDYETGTDGRPEIRHLKDAFQ